jgi:uncharacterized membrane protein YkoI
MIKRVLISLALAICALTVAGPVSANELVQSRPDVRDRYSADEAREQVRSGNVVRALDVIRDVRQRYPGADVLDAELERGAQPRYIIKILTRDGRRVDVVVDARSGAILYER